MEKKKVICQDCEQDLTEEAQYYERDAHGRLVAVLCEQCSWRRDEQEM